MFAIAFSELKNNNLNYRNKLNENNYYTIFECNSDINGLIKIINLLLITSNKFYIYTLNEINILKKNKMKILPNNLGFKYTILI